MTVLQIDREAARPFMDRYLDGSSFCDDRNDLAAAFADHREQVTAELVGLLAEIVDDVENCVPHISDWIIRARLALTKTTTNE